MTNKAAIFLKCECQRCNTVVSYLRVEEGEDAHSIALRVMEHYCEPCYEKQQKETEAMT